MRYLEAEQGLLLNYIPPLFGHYSDIYYYKGNCMSVCEVFGSRAGAFVDLFTSLHYLYIIEQ